MHSGFDTALMKLGAIIELLWIAVMLKSVFERRKKAVCWDGLRGKLCLPSVSNLYPFCTPQCAQVHELSKREGHKSVLPGGNHVPCPGNADGTSISVRCYMVTVLRRQRQKKELKVTYWRAKVVQAHEMLCGSVVVENPVCR